MSRRASTQGWIYNYLKSRSGPRNPDHFIPADRHSIPLALSKCRSGTQKTSKQANGSMIFAAHGCSPPFPVHRAACMLALRADLVNVVANLRHLGRFGDLWLK